MVKNTCFCTIITPRRRVLILRIKLHIDLRWRGETIEYVDTKVLHYLINREFLNSGYWVPPLTASFPVGFSLTVSEHARYIFSNAISARRTSKLLSWRYGHLKYLLSPFPYFKSIWYMQCILILTDHWKNKFL